MKGMVFTEFLDFAEDQFGLEEVDRMIAAAGSDGAFTSIGTYDHQELVRMLVALSESKQIPIPDLLKQFGHHLFGYLAKSYPSVLGDADDGFTLLRRIDDHIHVEVRKLYPDSELPQFSYEMMDDGSMQLTYRSERGLADLAEGLLRGCFEHFGQSVEIRREDLSGGKCQHVQFLIRQTS